MAQLNDKNVSLNLRPNGIKQKSPPMPLFKKSFLLIYREKKTDFLTIFRQKKMSDKIFYFILNLSSQSQILHTPSINVVPFGLVNLIIS